MVAPNFRSETGLAKIAPYLNPEYWDGYGLGQGNPSAQPYEDRILTLDQHRQASQYLTTLLNYDTPRPVVETYQKGQVFEPGNYRQGTIVAFRVETLNCCDPGGKLVVGNLTKRPLPSTVSGLTPGIRDFSRENLEISAPGELFYRYFVGWGVVMKRKRKQVLACALLHNTVRLDGLIGVASPCSEQSAGIKVGEVQHFLRFGGQSEKLKRILALEVSLRK